MRAHTAGGGHAWGRLGCGAAAGGLVGFLLRDLLPFEMASAWVPFALLGAIVATSRRLRRGAPALFLALGVVWAAAAFTPVTATLAASLVRRSAPRPADAVFVLASRLQTDGQLTATAESRLLHGLELVREGFAPRLVLTELPPPAPSYASFARSEIGRLGLQVGEVVSVGPVRSTREEAVRVGTLCRERAWKRLLVVTSPLHSRRACAALEREGVQVVCCPAPETRYDVETLDRPVERLRAFREVVREKLALWLYARRGWV